METLDSKLQCKQGSKLILIGHISTGDLGNLKELVIKKNFKELVKNYKTWWFCGR
jgi:hypothetical protein